MDFISSDKENLKKALKQQQNEINDYTIYKALSLFSHGGITHTALNIFSQSLALHHFKKRRIVSNIMSDTLFFFLAVVVPPLAALAALLRLAR